MEKKLDLDAIEATVTTAVRAADQAFEKSGGGSRHWVRECFLPAIEFAGLAIMPIAEVRALRDENARLRAQNDEARTFLAPLEKGWDG